MTINDETLPAFAPVATCRCCGNRVTHGDICAFCAPVPEIEFHGGKRPHEMTTGELLAAIAFSPAPDAETVGGRWATKLAAEFDRRRAQLQEAR